MKIQLKYGLALILCVPQLLMAANVEKAATTEVKKTQAVTSDVKASTAPTEAKDDSEARREAEKDVAKKPKVAKPTATQTQGKLYLRFDIPAKQFHESASFLVKNGDIESIVEGINDFFIFPTNIMLHFNNSEDGPYYRPDLKTIFYNYSDFDNIVKMYKERYPEDEKEEAHLFALDVVLYSVYHELGHAMVDVYQLPITADEETAVDNLAVILAMEYTENGFDIVIAGVEFWDLLQEAREKHGKTINDSEFWGEHDLNPQRMYNSLCLAYGANPKEAFNEIKDRGPEGLLLKFVNERDNYCIAQYERVNRAWHTLLKPYIREEE